MLKIGEFSKLSRVSVRMLRHYDEIGLLKPAEIDRFTDYRYYREDQLPTMCRITALKDMGFSLADIVKILEIYDDREALEGYFSTRQRELEELSRDTARKLALLDAARERLRKEQTMSYDITLKTIPERYAATALQTASGSAYTDSSGGWVDPYNTFIRTYLVSLCKELHDLGFDEVAFSYLQQPLSDTEVKYASQSGTPSRTDAVVSLAKYLRANLTATGLRVSAVVSADSILQSRAAQSGQDMAVFPKLFDRVCVFASADNVATLQSAIAADSSFDAATRFVPFLAKAPESGSYVTTG